MSILYLLYYWKGRNIMYVNSIFMQKNKISLCIKHAQLISHNWNWLFLLSVCSFVFLQTSLIAENRSLLFNNFKLLSLYSNLYKPVLLLSASHCIVTIRPRPSIITTVVGCRRILRFIVSSKRKKCYYFDIDTSIDAVNACYYIYHQNWILTATNY